jgi:hypothetical protein
LNVAAARDRLNVEHLAGFSDPGNSSRAQVVGDVGIERGVDATDFPRVNFPSPATWPPFSLLRSPPNARFLMRHDFEQDVAQRA